MWSPRGSFDPLALILSPIPIVVAFTYPYLKRFTWLAHFGIGAVYVIVPPAVAIAMTGTMPVEFVLLGIAALFWVSGFDVLYAIADINFDRAERSSLDTGQAFWDQEIAGNRQRVASRNPDFPSDFGLGRRIRLMGRAVGIVVVGALFA